MVARITSASTMRRFTHERSSTCDTAHHHWMRLCGTGGHRHRNKRSPCMTTSHAAAVPEAQLPPLTEGPHRKRIGLISIVAFLGGVLFVVFSPGFEILVAGRIILGLAVGGASTVVPVYLAELAPYEIRGSITGRNELAIVTGQLAAFVVNAIIGTVFGHVEGVWRFMFAVCALPAIA